MQAHDYAKTHADQFQRELHDFLKIPSVSADKSYTEDVRRAANWLKDHISDIGLTTELIEYDGRHPMVYAEWLGAGETAPTVLIYGHYDVQPAVLADGWDQEPFEPTERDGKIYARGATDDKGQLFIHVKAVEALIKSNELAVNVKFIIEGEEESGSQAITAFVSTHQEKLKADVCVVSDTSMSDITQPIIINSLRGVLAFEVIVNGPRNDLHSGMYGGSVHNPLQALAEIIAQLHKEDGSIAVPGFYDDVLALSAEEREVIAKIPWDNVDWAEATGAPVPWGEESFTLNERVGSRPTLELNGMAGGYWGEGGKSIIPAKAWAKISCRLVANQNPTDIMNKIRKFIEKITPPTVEIEIKERESGSGAVLINTNTPAMQAAIHAYEKGWGKAPLFKREGGSIPIIADFQKELGLPVILMGYGLDTDNLHAPNEHFSIEMFRKGIDTAIHFLHEVTLIDFE